MFINVSTYNTLRRKFQNMENCLIIKTVLLQILTPLRCLRWLSIVYSEPEDDVRFYVATWIIIVSSQTAHLLHCSNTGFPTGLERQRIRMIEDGKRRLTADCLVAVHGSHGCECKVQRPQGRGGERGALFTPTLSLSLPLCSSASLS